MIKIILILQIKGLKNYLEEFLLNNLVINNKLQTIYNEKYGELNGIQNIISYILRDYHERNAYLSQLISDIKEIINKYHGTRKQ